MLALSLWLIVVAAPGIVILWLLSGAHEACPPLSGRTVCYVILPSGSALAMPSPTHLGPAPAEKASLRESAHGPWYFLQDGHIALHLAVRRCQVEVIQTLIGQGCSVDFQDRHGNTPLHVACKDGNMPIVVALCEAGCNLDISNKVMVVGMQGPACAPGQLPLGVARLLFVSHHCSKSVLLTGTRVRSYRALNLTPYFILFF